MADFRFDERRITLVADSEMGFTTMRAVADRMNVSVMSTLRPEQVGFAPSTAAAGDMIMVDLRDEADDLASRLSGLDSVAAGTATPVIVNVSVDLLDMAAAYLAAPSVSLMSEATLPDWITTATLALNAPPPMLREANDDETIRLRRLAEEVARIASALSDLALNGSPTGPIMSDAIIGYRAPPIAAARGGMPEPVSHVVRGMIRARRLRDRFFPQDIFADPAWDMLLDLMAARLEGLRVAVSSLCIAAAVPPTTALRWIKTMTDAGLFVRRADQHDGRRVFIELSDRAAAGMNAWIDAARREGVLAA